MHVAEPTGAYSVKLHATHVAADAAPRAADALPAGHAWHALSDCPGAELNVPALQGEQAAASVAPTEFEPVPGGQRAQRRAPVLLLNDPGAHSTHSASDDEPVSGFDVPAGHGAHVSLVRAPEAFDVVPAGHERHAVAPSALECVPAGQSVQLSADAPPGSARNEPGAQN